MFKCFRISAATLKSSEVVANIFQEMMINELLRSRILVTEGDLTLVKLFNCD